MEYFQEPIMASNLSVIVLCGSSPRHLYVANKLCKGADVRAIFQEKGREVSVAKVVKWISKPKILWRKICRKIREFDRYSGKREAAFFFEKREPELDEKELLIEVQYINHQKVVDLVKKYNPDIIAVFGTSLIRGELLNHGKFGIVNLHGGLSPHYRGADCTFWALYNGEPERVGCTLHFINEGIDTGNLIAHVRPEVYPDDSEDSLFWRGVKSSADVYIELFERLEKGETFGQVQNERGQLYQVKDRLLKHELALNKLMEQGLLKNCYYKLRVHWFPQKMEYSK